MLFGQVVSDEVQVISNTLIIFNRLARFKIKFVKRDHLKVVDLQDDFNPAPKLQLRDPSLLVQSVQERGRIVVRVLDD
jgi:hypothetical protein